jgi:hypothetical protein
MVNIATLKVVDKSTGTVVSEFEINSEPPAVDDIVWVPDNGDVPYHVEGRRFDYDTGTVILGCVENSEIEGNSV